MSRNALLEALFPEAVGVTTTEDGIGTYHDRHARDQIARQTAKQTARAKKLKKLAQKKRRAARAGVISAKVTVQVNVTVTYPVRAAPPAPPVVSHPKREAERFEDCPYAMGYRRQPVRYDLIAGRRRGY